MSNTSSNTSPNSAPSPPNNPALGSVYMSIGMAGYVVNDTLVKTISYDLPLGTLLVTRGAFAIIFMILLIAIMGQLNQWRALFSKPVLMRACFDVVATFLFLTALFNSSIATVTALLQAVPLAVVLFGVMFLNERIGWRRISAIFVGFIGVMLILQPGAAAFEPYSLLVIGVIILVAMRDTMTRRIPSGTPTLFITLANVVLVTIAGSIYAVYQGVSAISQNHVLTLGAAAIFLVFATLSVVLASRVAQLSATAPFRYTAVLWSLLSAYFVFDQTPNTLAIIGIVLISVSGMYALLRTA